jgi:UDP-2,3-diacylglucosamine pyrophosphatase LpxH
MSFTVISDLHLGDGSEADEFQGADGDLRSFLKEVKNGELVLNGDIFELLKFEMADIIHAHADLILDIFSKTRLYIVGNHDREMLNHSFGEPAYLCKPIAQYAILEDTLFMHGHQFDPFNDESHMIGDTITGLMGAISDGWWGNEVNELGRRLEDLAGKVGRDGDPAAYRIRALNFLEHFIIGMGSGWITNPSGEAEEKVWSKHLKRIVLAHTHTPDHGDFNTRFYYWNSGCWILGNRNFVTLEF